jgi:hypothetical protein
MQLCMCPGQGGEALAMGGGRRPGGHKQIQQCNTWKIDRRWQFWRLNFHVCRDQPHGNSEAVDWKIDDNTYEHLTRIVECGLVTSGSVKLNGGTNATRRMSRIIVPHSVHVPAPPIG